MASQRQGTGTKKGTVATITHEGQILVRTDERWLPGEKVVAGTRLLGSVRSVFGPVARPYVVVAPSGLSSGELLTLVGASVTTR